MTTPYELWDTESGNCLGAYDTEEEALLDFAHSLEVAGPAAMVTVALGGGDLERAIEGPRLLHRASAAAARRGITIGGTTLSPDADQDIPQGALARDRRRGV